MENNIKFCNSVIQYSRFVTREIIIGTIKLGAHNPIVIQSMTNTDTLDTEKSVEQCIKIFDAGADMVRLTTQTSKHAENLANIKNQLLQKNYQGPLIADVHFDPKVANTAAQIVEKVRINPGNFVDRKTGPEIETQEQYQEELARIEEQLIPLLNICKEHKTALRIGSNHGSLSRRIVNRYGDTAEGMVQSVLEFIEITRKYDFQDIVISLKASNTRIMVYAYRLLLNKMIEKSWNYPVHLGVTEAGDGEDGRIKSAIGIGSLLADGIGDTIRVSLTEDPELEIPVAKAIIKHFENRFNHQQINGLDELVINPFEYSKRKTTQSTEIGSHKQSVVIVDLSNQASILDSDLQKIGYKTDIDGKWLATDIAPDFIFAGQAFISVLNPEGLKIISDIEDWEDTADNYPYFEDIQTYTDSKRKSDKMNFISVLNSSENIEKLIELKTDPSIILFLESKNENSVADKRAFIQILMKNDILFPVIIKNSYKEKDHTLFQIKSSCDMGQAFIDGYADGILLSNKLEKDIQKVLKTSYGILQATRTRMFKTEFISCPSCGRTLFEIQKVVEQLKKQTGHLKGLKLAVMGCIVNGPGEMADADYGYVGAGVGKISLYKGKEIVKKNISSEDAIDELIQLIKDNGDWKEPDN